MDDRCLCYLLSAVRVVGMGSILSLNEDHFLCFCFLYAITFVV